MNNALNKFLLSGLALGAVALLACGPATPKPDPGGEYEYSLCFLNAQPGGRETYTVPGWLLTAWAEGPVYVYRAATEGCYYFQGPTLDESEETIVLHAVHPCFADLRPRIELTRGQTEYLPVLRNDLPCTDAYELECAAVHDPWIESLADDYLDTEVSIRSCCELYPGTTQPVCRLCPDFDGSICAGKETVIHNGTCACAL